MNQNLDAILDELKSRKSSWPKYNSPHEGLAVIGQEFDDLKREVYIKPSRRDLEKMRESALNLAQAAIRFLTEVCDENSGRK